MEEEKAMERRFTKNTRSKEAFEILMHDLECLELKQTKDNEYHYKLLKGNLRDLFGVKDEAI